MSCKMASIYHPRPPRESQDCPERRPEGPNLLPRSTQDTPKRLPRGPERLPRGTQDAPPCRWGMRWNSVWSHEACEGSAESNSSLGGGVNPPRIGEGGVWKKKEKNSLYHLRPEGWWDFGGVSWRPLGAPREHLCRSQRPLGASWVALGSLSGPLGSLLGVSWGLLGSQLGPLGRPLGPSWDSWRPKGHLDAILEEHRPSIISNRLLSLC